MAPTTPVLKLTQNVTYCQEVTNKVLFKFFAIHTEYITTMLLILYYLANLCDYYFGWVENRHLIKQNDLILNKSYHLRNTPYSLLNKRNHVKFEYF